MFYLIILVMRRLEPADAQWILISFSWANMDTERSQSQSRWHYAMYIYDAATTQTVPTTYY